MRSVRRAHGDRNGRARRRVDRRGREGRRRECGQGRRRAESDQCTSSRETCLTTAELIDLWENPPESGHHDAGPPPLDPNGCLPRAVTFDDCCSAAFAGPEVRDDTCCYRFCIGACCDRAH
ncbi:hypothetical protein BH09MYX1_BH09MYX1_67600 [soil metagenome]